MLYGALEAGGTKMVCSTGDADGRVFTRESIPTTTPEETISRLIAFFRDAGIDALGVGSFGPVDLHEDSPTYGYITTTPKLAWRFFPLLDTLRNALNIPVGFGTDVGLAAIAEHTLGAARGTENSIYVTVGTGVGAGIIVGGKLLRGLVHPEFGHFWLRPHPDDPTPHGFCPYHDGCVEGLATGPAIEQRWDVDKAHILPTDHPAWALEAYYLAQMCTTAVVVLSPERIVLGGGVMQQTHLFPHIRHHVQEMLGGYVQNEMIIDRIDEYIVPPGLGSNSGVTGALLLAAEAATDAYGA